MVSALPRLRPPLSHRQRLSGLPGCEAPRWTATAVAIRFPAELARHGTDRIPLDAFEQGQRLCSRGYNPAFAVRVVLELHRRG